MNKMPVQYHGSFPPIQIQWEPLVPYIAQANAAIARYDGILSAIPNRSVLLSPLTTQEAVLSSRIEGTQATIGEVLEFEAQGEQKDDNPSQKKLDIQEVLNYRKALRTAEAMLNDIPLSLRLIKESHRVLLTDVRGQNKAPGEFRRIPNWIGPQGCKVEDATYVPISAEKLEDAMSRWERFLHESYPDRLVQLALIHAEFEALHPFLDGNGRIGRMLVPLYLYQAKTISAPMFYVSAYLEANRDTYYEKLLAVSRDDDWTGWCEFFLTALKHQAEDNQLKAKAILDLYNEMKLRFAEITHSQYAIHALDWIFRYPVFKSTDLVSAEIPKPTATRIIRVLKEDNILTLLSKSSGRRSAVLAFPALLNIAEGRSVF